MSGFNEMKDKLSSKATKNKGIYGSGGGSGGSGLTASTMNHDLLNMNLMQQVHAHANVRKRTYTPPTLT